MHLFVVNPKAAKPWLQTRGFKQGAPIRSRVQREVAPVLKIKEYKKNFHHHEIPDAFARLVEFQNSQAAPFCRGFSLAIDDRKKLLPISEKREFLDALCPLGPANSAGALYALWAREGEKQLDHSPVLTFGDEGSVHVVAEDVPQLLRILTFDAEPMIDADSVLFMKDDSEPQSPGAMAYALWFEKHVHHKPAKDSAEVELIVRSAQSLLEKPLQSWLKHFKAH